MTAPYLRFPGQWIDNWARFSSAFDLSNNVFRWYDAQTGRYTSPDPIGGVNPYVYADDDPLTEFDPYGLLVEVRCERIGWQGFTRSTLAAFYHHCFVHTKCPCTKRHPFDKTVETGGAPAGQRPPLHINDFDGSRGSNDGIIVQPPGSTDCSKEQCILDQANVLMATHPGYNPRGPNSNTFAHQLLSACGMEALVPDGDPPVGWNHPWSK